MPDVTETKVEIPCNGRLLAGDLRLPPTPKGLVIFAHGSGSSRHSPRNRQVAAALNDGGLATLLLDLLTPDEEELDTFTANLRFDVELLAERLVAASTWAGTWHSTEALPVAYFGASTGAAAALIAARQMPVVAVVSRGGRPDLAGKHLAFVEAPTLFIVGGADPAVITLNEQALLMLGNARVKLEIVPGATHLFAEKGALERVASLALTWLDEAFALFARQRPSPSVLTSSSGKSAPSSDQSGA